MREQIENLIGEQKLFRLECFEMLQELNSIDTTKLSTKEKLELRESIIRNEEELSLRLGFINELEKLC